MHWVCGVDVGGVRDAVLLAVVMWIRKQALSGNDVRARWLSSKKNEVMLLISSPAAHLLLTYFTHILPPPCLRFIVWPLMRTCSWASDSVMWSRNIQLLQIKCISKLAIRYIYSVKFVLFFPNLNFNNQKLCCINRINKALLNLL